MLSHNNPDRIRVVFDDHCLVANAGLLPPAILARHLGLRELVDHHLDLGNAPGLANTGDCIDDADALRTGGDGLHPGRHGQDAFHPRLREGRLWAPSCAASDRATSANWTG